jgi:hypothetical protein
MIVSENGNTSIGNTYTAGSTIITINIFGEIIINNYFTV